MPITVHRATPREPKKSLGERTGFNQAAVNAITGFANARSAESADKQLEELTGMNLRGVDPQTKKLIIAQKLQGQRDLAVEREKQSFKNQQQDQKQKFLNQILGGGQQTQGQHNQQVGINPQNDQMNQEMSQQSQKNGFDVSQLSDEDIARATSIDPNLGKALGHAKDVSLREKTARRKEVSESYGENKDFVNKTYDQFEDANRKEAILDRMNQLNDSGELSGSGMINFLESLGLKSEWLKNPSNEEYTKLSLDLLGGGSLQADYGSRVLASEFKVSQQRIPTLSQTPEGRRQIAQNMETMLLPSRLKEDRMQYYLDKAERTGEPLPHNLRGKILKDIKPQLDEVYDKFKQRNGRYKVKDGTYPDDNAIEKYYYLSDGNEVKAKQMMQQDGYDIQPRKGLTGGSVRTR